MQVVKPRPRRRERIRRTGRTGGRTLPETTWLPSTNASRPEDLVTDASPPIDVTAEARALIAAALGQAGTARYVRIRVGRG